MEVAGAESHFPVGNDNPAKQNKHMWLHMAGHMCISCEGLITKDPVPKLLRILSGTTSLLIATCEAVSCSEGAVSTLTLKP